MTLFGGGGKVFVNVIKNLKMRRSSWKIWVGPKPVTNVLIRVGGGRRPDKDRRGGSNVIAVTKVMWLQVKECQQLPEAGTVKEHAVP